MTILFFNNSIPALPYMFLFMVFNLLTYPSVIPLVMSSLMVFLTAWKSLIIPRINVFKDAMLVFQQHLIHLMSSVISFPFITWQNLYVAPNISLSHGKETSRSKVFCCSSFISLRFNAMSIMDMSSLLEAAQNDCLAASHSVEKDSCFWGYTLCVRPKDICSVHKKETGCQRIPSGWFPYGLCKVTSPFSIPALHKRHTCSTHCATCCFFVVVPSFYSI